MRKAVDTTLAAAVDAAVQFHGADYGLQVLLYKLDEWREILVPPRGPTTPSKRTIPHDLRWEVFKRDDFRCKHCGTRDNLSADHIHPESAGGTLALDNLQTLCRACNSRKGARHS